MDSHHDRDDPPEFKWTVIDSYKDALRRQLGEGLHILNAGALNRKCEFNSNIICRMEARADVKTSDKELQEEVVRRKSYMEKLRQFICDKKYTSPHVFNEKKLKRVGCHPVPNERNISSRYKQAHIVVHKRKRSTMETSTPVLAHREPQPILMDDDSPINETNHSVINSSSSSEKIPDYKRKAGISNEVNSMAVTPEKELSPDTMDKRLVLHSIDIVRASQDNQ